MFLKYLKLIISILILLHFLSCKKFLDAKSNQKLSTPSTLDDLQGILDNSTLYVSIAVINTASDEYYTDEATLTSLMSPFSEKTYIWDLPAQYDEDWGLQYRTLLAANTVLDNLNEIPKETGEQKWNAIKGAALFYRAHVFYWLLQTYAKQYNKNSASTDLGIPLRLTANFNTPSVRATIQQSYDQILTDLNAAYPLLSKGILYRTRPSKPAAFALLARTYLAMGNYDKAKAFSDSTLNNYNTLIDYNTIDPASHNPKPVDNPEVIMYFRNDATISGYGFPYAITDSNLLKLYNGNDLRKIVFFVDNGDGTKSYKGYYNEDYFVFNGIATDELYLIRAECKVKQNDINGALSDLNALLEKRWKAGTFTPVDVTDALQLLQIILEERRKELLYRGLRWIDIRRLNNEGANIVLKRVLGSNTYTLPPNDNRSVFLIPQQVIDQSGIPQNPR